MDDTTGLFGQHDAISGHSLTWFVYVLSSSDCTAFKVGYSCSPLQRFHTFSHRYYERFDLGESWLLALPTCDAARTVEAALKTDLTEFRAPAPTWVPVEAGGQTEWFGAVERARAADKLSSFTSVYQVEQLAIAEDYLRAQLARLTLPFESWALSQARQVCGLAQTLRTRPLALAVGRSLRDWLDAYRHFDVPLFVDDPAMREFVVGTARAAMAA